MVFCVWTGQKVAPEKAMRLTWIKILSAILFVIVLEGSEEFVKLK